MSGKRILFLGAAHQQLPPIEYALAQGHYVITCDFLPENPGHKLAHEWHNISTTDLEAVLQLAKKSSIDGIVAYASDPAAPTQAYVAEQLGLPGNPFHSVNILCRKDLFRQFLEKHQFHVPKSQSFADLQNATQWLNEIDMPVIVKPVDSSGSKGVTKIEHADDFAKAFEHAMQFSRIKKVIVEQFFVKEGYQTDGDGFVINGQLVVHEGGNQHNDHLCHSYVPSGISFPSVLDGQRKALARSELQRLISLLNISTGAINFEYQFNQDGTFFLIELAPRNGGNLIPEVIQHTTGFDMVRFTVDAALGLPLTQPSTIKHRGFYASYLIHSLKDGIVDSVWYSDEILNHILKKELYIKTGDAVSKFNGSNQTLGAVILQFDSQLDMLSKLDAMNEHIKVFIR